MLEANNLFKNQKGVLEIDNISSLKLADEFNTPIYIISERKIRENYRRLFEVFSKQYNRIRIYYSAKANTNLSVLKILKSEGAYLDVVSPGEAFLAKQAGFKEEEILFTGTSVNDDELQFFNNLKITVNIDSISQLRRTLKLHVPKILSFRVNPEVGAGHHEHVITAGKKSKFGIWEENILDAYRTAKEAGVKRFGIQMHIGSGILTSGPFLLAAKKLLKIAGAIHKELNIDFEFIDFGGGLGIPYRPKEKPLNLNDLAEKVLGLFKKKVKEHNLGNPMFGIEPGRFIVADAGVLLTRVNTVKVTPFKKFVGVDAGFNTLVRPTMYGSFHFIVVANKLNEPSKELYDVVGPICESGDHLAIDRKLPNIVEGDLLAVLNAGAYGFSMSSQYNSRPRCPEILVNNGKYSQIRRKENYEILLKGQKYPSWFE
jgi:diaminopimelate decarboxylase